ncbi:MAG: fused MFS/spermidine synthase, partial [Pseudomonadota bacterium]
LYAALELVIGAWALALIYLIPGFNAAVFAALGATPTALWHWTVAFGGTFVLLLPATCAMGATLPAMERILSDSVDGPRVGGLYAANTAGAMLGTLAGTFILARLLGYGATLVVLAGINVTCAVLVLAAARPAPVEPRADKSPSAATPAATLAGALALTGFLGLGYEVVAMRVLSQVLENTVFTFASLLATYLMGTAIGAAIYQRRRRAQSFAPVLRSIMIGLSATSLAGVLALAAAPQLHTWLVGVLGDGMTAGVAGEWIVALTVFLPPTLFMGASFAHLAQSARGTLGVGGAVALNTLGAALAPVVFGVLLLPVIGSRACLLVIAAAYLLLWPGGLRTAPRTAAALTAGVAVVAMMPVSLRVVSVPPGGQVLDFVEGRMANVAVASDPAGIRFLKVNNQYTMGSTNSRFSDRRQAHLPLLMHPSPRETLFLGLGTGATFATTAVHPDLNATAVELLPEILPVLARFGMSEQAFQDDPRLSLVTADARRFVASTDRSYDVIVADVFHPARDGAAALYSREHFATIRERLNDQGLFCQWLPLFQLDLPTLASITATFMTVFTEAEMHLAHFSLGQPIVGLIGRRGGRAVPAPYLADRAVDPALARDLASVRLDDDFALYGGFVAGGPALARFAASAPLNTDDHPVVAWSAPHFLFATPEPAYVRLLALVDALQTRPEDIFDDALPDDWRRRLAAYWQARDEYLSVGVDVTLTNDTRKMLERIGQPLMQLVEKSPDFSPAYMPLLQMAIELADSDPLVSRALLLRLELAAPGRREAARAREQLFPAPGPQE